MTDRIVTGRFDEQPRVDIILPTRNRAEQTWEAVQSVLAQSYQKWRLIIVDDASDPMELRKLEGLLPSHNRIQFVRRTRPGGAQSARQTGLSYSRAPLIAFLDSDDLWLADKLQRQVSVLMATASPSSKAIVLCGYQWLTPEGTTRLTSVPTRANFLNYDNVSSVLVTARALEAAGGVRRTDDAPLVTAEGIDLFIRLFQAAEVLIAPECLTLCRAHSGPRNSTQSRDTHATAYAELIRRYLTFLESKAPSLYHRLSLRAGWRLLEGGHYGAALRYLGTAFREGSALERFEVLKVVAWVASRRLSTHSRPN